MGKESGSTHEGGWTGDTTKGLLGDARSPPMASAAAATLLLYIQ